VEAMLRYYLCDNISRQLSQMLQGIFDVLPQSLLSVFDAQEVELLMCGLPSIDVRRVVS
jgi:hypothetical protein